MIKTSIKGGLLGGIVVFFWGMVSWMVLPWHDATLRAFDDDAAVAPVIEGSAPKDGVYILPNPHQREDFKPGADALLVFASVRRGIPGMGRAMGLNLLLHVASALLLTWLLFLANLGFADRLKLVGAVALFAGLVSHVPYAIWWGFPCGYTLVAVVDTVIGWSLAGLAISKFALSGD